MNQERRYKKGEGCRLIHVSVGVFALNFSSSRKTMYKWSRNSEKRLDKRKVVQGREVT